MGDGLARSDYPALARLLPGLRPPRAMLIDEARRALDEIDRLRECRNSSELLQDDESFWVFKTPRPT